VPFQPRVQVAQHVYAMIVPGSGLVKQQAEAEGLDAIFIAAVRCMAASGTAAWLHLAPLHRCMAASGFVERRLGPHGACGLRMLHHTTLHVATWCAALLQLSPLQHPMLRRLQRCVLAWHGYRLCGRRRGSTGARRAAQCALA
jgi:hypothetical protein